MNPTPMVMHVLRLLFLVVVMGGLAAWLAWNGVRALRSGRANAHGVTYRRSKQPLMFWLTVMVQCAFALMILAGLSHQLFFHR